MYGPRGGDVSYERGTPSATGPHRAERSAGVRPNRSLYRGTSPIRNYLPLEPYRRPRVLGGS